MAKARESIRTEPDDQVITFSEYEWVTIEDNILTIGLTDEGVDSVTEITRADLPAESTVVDADEVCGELETPDGPMHLYSPVKGSIVEINAAVVENPDLIAEDPFGDGWLIKVEAEDPKELASFVAAQARKNDDDEDDDDFEDDEDLDADFDEDDEEEESYEDDE